MNLWPVEHFFELICHNFWVGLLLPQWVCCCTQPKVIKKMKKRGNWSEFHFSEVTSYKIHTLVSGGQVFAGCLDFFSKPPCTPIQFELF